MSAAAAVLWHDLECGAYRADLAGWRALAAAHPGPLLDIGAGTGRVSLDLARAGATVTALDLDAELLDALAARAASEGLSVDTLLADARAFTLPAPVALCLVPMQTVQLLAGPEDRARMLACVHAALTPGGRLALAIAEELECFEVRPGAPAPLPDVCEHDGTVYASRPLAVRRAGDGFELERRRETVSPAGELVAETDLVRLTRLSADTLEADGAAAGFTVGPRTHIPTTAEHVGSTVVTLDA